MPGDYGQSSRYVHAASVWLDDVIAASTDQREHCLYLRNFGKSKEEFIFPTDMFNWIHGVESFWFISAVIMKGIWSLQCDY